LDPRSIVRAAERRTGLNDWGDDRVMTALDAMSSHVARPEFTHLSRALSRQTLVKGGALRLRLVEYLKSNPAIGKTPIERPVFVLGFPRSGTTLLQNLLCLSDSRRGLEFWELNNPVPVCEDKVADQERRKKSAGRVLDLAYRLAPEMREIHEVGVDTFEECWYLFWPTFMVLNTDLQTSLPTLGDWLMTADMRWAYGEYRRTLQGLIHERPTEQLVVKCPEHLWFLDSLLEVFPDACIVWNHRDPVASIASYCSLISLPHRMHFGSFDTKLIGEHITHRFHEGVSRAMDMRAKAEPGQVFDVDFGALCTDPAAVVRQVTDHFGLAPVQEARIEAYLNNGRADKKGAHKYDAARYGLDSQAIRTRFADYIAAHGL
jgi:hypothetical protein